MYEVKVFDKKNNCFFKKIFDSLYLLRNYKIRLSYSKRYFIKDIKNLYL